MDAIAHKLVKALGVDVVTASKLVEAGLSTENRAKQASRRKLAAIGISEEMIDQIKPGLRCIPTSARSGQGMDDLAAALSALFQTR